MKHDYIINLYLPNKQIFPCAGQRNTLGIAVRWYISFIFSRVNSLSLVSLSQELSIHWVWEDNFLLDLLQGMRQIPTSSWEWLTAAGCELLNHKLFAHSTSTFLLRLIIIIVQYRKSQSISFLVCTWSTKTWRNYNFNHTKLNSFMVTMPPVYTKVWTMKYLIMISKVVCPFSNRKQ